MESFPQVTSNSLNKNEYTIPHDLKGEYNVVIVAFQRDHQRDVNTWIPFLDPLEQQTGGRLRYYELPTVRRGNPMFRWYLDGVMRAGIQDRETRERTITLYLDVEEFCQQLGIDTKEIHTYLLDKSGTILSHQSGRYTEEKGKQLYQEIQKLSVPNFK